MKTVEKILNLETGEESVIEREMTSEEVKQYKAAMERNKELTERLAEQAAAKAALLERLGITEEEAKLLLG